MGLQRRIAIGVLASYVARALQIVLNLALLPIMFRHLSDEVVGMWFLLGQANLFLGLLDFGFGPTLTRRIAFATAPSVAHADVKLSEAGREKLGHLIATGKVIYRSLAFIVLLLAGSTGMILLRRVTTNDLSQGQVLVAWALFCISYAINTWGALWVALLGGLGYVGSASLIGIIIQVAAMIIKIVVVLLGGGLLPLAITECIASVATRQVARAYLHWKEPELATCPGKWSPAEFYSLLNPAIKNWLTALGAFLILQTDQFFIVAYRGVAQIADYRATYSVFSNLNILATTFSLVSSPFYSQLWQSGHLEMMHTILFRNLKVGLGIMLAGLVAVVGSSPSLFNLWLGPGHFVGFPILLAFSTMLLLETQHGLFVLAARSTEDEVYVPWALGAGVLNLVLTGLLVQPLGLLGVALGTMLAQITTNNWFCVAHGLSRLRVRFATYFREVLTPLAMLGLVTALPIAVVMPSLPLLPQDDFARIVIACGWCGFWLLVFLLKFALTVDERFRIANMLRTMTPTEVLRRFSR